MRIRCLDFSPRFSGLQSQAGQSIDLGDRGAGLGGDYLDALGIVLDEQNNVLVLIQSHSPLGAAHQLHGGDGVSRSHVELRPGNGRTARRACC